MDGLPATLSGIGQPCYLLGRDVLSLDDGAIGLPWLHRNQHEVLFQPCENVFVVGHLDTLGPKVAGVQMAAEAGHANADSVLCTTDDAVVALRMILETEHETSECFGIHGG